MIQGLLTTDPEKRFKLKDVKNHQWFRQLDEAVSPTAGIKVGAHNIPVDPLIIEQLS